MHERRKHPRIALKAEDFPLLFVQDDNRKRIPLTAVNLSQQGVGFLCTHQFNLDEELQTMLVLPGFTPICCHGTIRFKKEVWGLHGYGMELDLDMNCKDIIDRYLLAVSHGG